MADVVAELLDQVIELEVDLVDVQLLRQAQRLRDAAEMYPSVEIHLTPPAARLLAADLEELAMLRMVPPTGDDG
jgi:hypothetical protein